MIGFAQTRHTLGPCDLALVVELALEEPAGAAIEGARRELPRGLLALVLPEVGQRLWPAGEPAQREAAVVERLGVVGGQSVHVVQQGHGRLGVIVQTGDDGARQAPVTR